MIVLTCHRCRAHCTLLIKVGRVMLCMACAGEKR